MSNDQFTGGLPDDFSGIVRLFPLPNLVMFPHVVQPLHIFESRYRQMLEDALEGDRLVTMALLQPGWEGQYEGRPAIFPVTCIGRVVAHSRLDDGQYNILLSGLRRASVLRELPPARSFRTAEVAVLEDLYPASGSHRRAKIQWELLRCFRSLTHQSPAGQEQLEQLLSNQLPLGVLTDIISFAVNLEILFKQSLLTEWNVDLRAQMLLERLRAIVGGDLSEGKTAKQPFPPEFSVN